MLLLFLKSGYCKVKKENKSQANAQLWVYLDPAPNHPRDAVGVPNEHCTLHIARHVTWQRVSPASFVPAHMRAPCLMKKGGVEADDEGTSSQGSRG